MVSKHSRGRTNLLIGVMLVGLGVLFMLGQVFRINLWQFLWPFFIIVPGVLFFVGMVLGGKPAGPLAIPGSIVTMVGVLLLYQSVTGHWESWAYAWALIFPTAVGIGLVINGGWSDVDRLVGIGMKWVTVGLAIFLIAGLFFELVLNISRGFIGDVIWPAMLIGVGAFLLIRRGGRRARHEASQTLPAQQAASPEVKEVEFEPLDMTRQK
jgi:hypothetical protein